jgi:UDP-N-acetylmuramoyl-tripeptide--D-alanyl-D-alanine ligase
MRRTVAELAAMLGTAPSGMATGVVTGVAIDSRAVCPGDLFVALPGAHVDGHDFVAPARTLGAAAALVTRPLAVDLPQIVVPDTLAALARIASAERSAGSYRVAAVTGSIAKTTTKELLAALLATSFRVGITHGNRNSESGFPVELCNLPEDVEWMVAELGMSHAGELDRLGAIACPDLLLYTVVAPVHLEFFPSIDAIAEAKAELIPHLRTAGTLVLNAADPRVAAFERRFAGRVVRFGVPASSDLWIAEYRSHGLLGARVGLRGPLGELDVELPLAGRHQADNLLAAATAALVLGVAPAAIAATARTVKPVARRGEVLTLTGGVTVVDDSYNASPEAVTRMLDLLADTPGRRVAVLGEMLELGESSPAFHRQVGAHAGACADLVIAVGGAAAAELAHAANDGKAHHVSDADAALALVRDHLRAGDVVLVKGSRGIGLDRVVDALRAGVTA